MTNFAMEDCRPAQQVEVERTGKLSLKQMVEIAEFEVRFVLAPKKKSAADYLASMSLFSDLKAQKGRIRMTCYSKREAFQLQQSIRGSAVVY